MGLLTVSKEAADGTTRRHAWDPPLAKERKSVLKMIAAAVALLLVAQWTVISVYFGSYFRQTENAYRLTVRILDMDSQYASQVAGAPAAVLGPAVVQAAEMNAAMKPEYHLGWQIAPSSELQTLRVEQGGQGLNASDYARNLVTNQDVWAVILINPNATVLATQAAQQGSSSYDPRGAISFFYTEARNIYASQQYVVPLSTQLLSSAIAQASSQFASQIVSAAAPGGGNAGGNITALNSALNGKALAYPFWYSQFNLRPYDQLAGEAATTAGEIYLVIFTFFMSPIWFKAFEPMRRKLTLTSQMLVQWGVPVACYFWISLNYSLVTLAFHTDFTRQFSYGGFPLFWANNFTAMTALGLVMETMLRVVGPLFFPFFLIFWVVWNVSTAFLDLSAMDPFYSYGFAFPVWNSVDTGKAIIYGTKNHLTQNFVVNLGWVIGGTIALLSVAAYKRKQQDKAEYNERVEKVEHERQEKREKRLNGEEDARAHEQHASEEDTTAGSDDSSDATRRV
ncbi:hypothetical protein P389DRAFT_73741 [Cystobasidium minutum MCA 4210]|uniref:uncharacterized protein n=1 Tax=Cystobasidium minutum MCA 4210 TaxID=1397322 RepID=UPI0034CF64F9|eukprot:jgi/Rhomi1/73741/CE73740_1636